MSQEEEKLIKNKYPLTSEEKKIIWELRNILCSFPFELPIKIMGLIQRLRRETYDSGKLAGFEMCEKLIPNDGLLYRIKSLIEEEKKKL